MTYINSNAISMLLVQHNWPKPQEALELVLNIQDFQKEQNVRLKVGYELVDKEHRYAINLFETLVLTKDAKSESAKEETGSKSPKEEDDDMGLINDKKSDEVDLGLISDIIPTNSKRRCLETMIDQSDFDVEKFCENFEMKTEIRDVAKNQVLSADSLTPEILATLASLAKANSNGQQLSGQSAIPTGFSHSQQSLEFDAEKNERYQSTLKFTASLLLQIQQKHPRVGQALLQQLVRTDIGEKGMTEGTKENRNKSKSWKIGEIKYKQNITCWKCNQKGHFQNQCLKLVASRDKEVNTAAGDSDDALVCCVENTVEDRIIDSGASFHTTYCKEKLERFKLRSGKIRLTDDKTLDIAAVGDVVLKTSFGTSWILKDVRYIPGLKRRLISVGQLDKEGYHIGF
ncbi:retrovirus-related pol polyprotein from transposon TNT 1-94 [Tanacetum coccineum]